MKPASSREFQDLAGCLSAQHDLYVNLIDVLASEKNFLILADVTSLIDNNKLKDALLSRSRALEKTRQGLVADLLKFLGREPADRPLSEIIPLLEAGEARKLIGLQAALSELLRRIRDANLQNERLVTNAKNAIDSGLRAIKGEESGGGVYKKQGRLERGGTPGKIVRKEI